MVIVTTLGTSLTSIVTYFKLHTMLMAKRTAMEDLELLKKDWLQHVNAPTENDPATVHKLVSAVENAFAAEASTWVVSKNEQHEGQSLFGTQSANATDSQQPLSPDGASLRTKTTPGGLRGV